MLCGSRRNCNTPGSAFVKTARASHSRDWAPTPTLSLTLTLALPPALSPYSRGVETPTRSKKHAVLPRIVRATKMALLEKGGYRSLDINVCGVKSTSVSTAYLCKGKLAE